MRELIKDTIGLIKMEKSERKRKRKKKKKPNQTLDLAITRRVFYNHCCPQKVHVYEMMRKLKKKVSKLCCFRRIRH